MKKRSKFSLHGLAQEAANGTLKARMVREPHGWIPKVKASPLVEGEVVVAPGIKFILPTITLDESIVLPVMLPPEPTS